MKRLVAGINILLALTTVSAQAAEKYIPQGLDPVMGRVHSDSEEPRLREDTMSTPAPLTAQGTQSL